MEVYPGEGCPWRLAEEWSWCSRSISSVSAEAEVNGVHQTPGRSPGGQVKEVGSCRL